jgi:hypothetical protein
MAEVAFEYNGEPYRLDGDEVTGKEWDAVEKLTGHGGLSFMEAFLAAKPVVDAAGVQRKTPDGTPRFTLAGVSGAMVNAWAWLGAKHAGRDPGPIEDVDVAYVPFLLGVMRGLAASLGVELKDPAAEVDQPPLAPSSTSSGPSPAPVPKPSKRTNATPGSATTRGPAARSRASAKSTPGSSRKSSGGSRSRSTG